MQQQILHRSDCLPWFKFGAIGFGVSGVSFGAAELQQQGCSSSDGQERCSRSTGVKRCRRRAEVWCRSKADEESRTIVERDCTIEVCLGLWEFWLGMLAVGIFWLLGILVPFVGLFSVVGYLIYVAV